MNTNGMAGFPRRQLRVIALIASGDTTHQIAAKMGVKLDTVYQYTQSIYRKAGLKTHTDLIEWAKDNGLDDPGLVTPGTPDMRRSRNRKMRGFFGPKTIALP